MNLFKYKKILSINILIFIFLTITPSIFFSTYRLILNLISITIKSNLFIMPLQDLLKYMKIKKNLLLFKSYSYT